MKTQDLSKDLTVIHKNGKRVISDDKGNPYIEGISKSMIITNPGLFIDELPILIKGLGIKQEDKSYQSAVKIIENSFFLPNLTMIGTSIQGIKSILVFITTSKRVLLRVNRLTGQWEQDKSATLENCKRR